MAKLQKWEKEIILQKYKASQQEKRCEIVQVLKKQINLLTNEIDKDIKELKNTKHNILVEEKLAGVMESSYGCNIEEKHPDLIRHDKKTNKEIIRIIREE